MEGQCPGRQEKLGLHTVRGDVEKPLIVGFSRWLDAPTTDPWKLYNKIIVNQITALEKLNNMQQYGTTMMNC